MYLPIYVSDKVRIKNCLLWIFNMGLDSEVFRHERASFDERVRWESLQKERQRQMLSSLHQKIWILAADVLFLWKAGIPSALPHTFSPWLESLWLTSNYLSGRRKYICGQLTWRNIRSLLSYLMSNDGDFKVKGNGEDFSCHADCAFFKFYLQVFLLIL